MTDNSDKKHQDSDDEQRKPEFNPEKCSDEFYWRYKNGERFPEECKDVLNKLSSHILSTAAFMHWDEMMCASLGLGLTDKCLPITNPESSTTTTTTTELLLRHFAPLVSVVQLLHPPGPNPPGPNSGEKRTRSLNLYHVGLLCRSTATVQSAMLWVMTKGYNFLAAWSLAKFLLVIQGDLKILRGTAQNLAEQLECVTGGCAHALLIQHRHQLTWAVLQLQVFSDLALKIFSIDVKKMSVEIFEQTMPTAKHWRVNKQELPSRPSEYAASAAQTVIVQVLEALRCLPGEDGCPALVTAVTAFMEAWMEHIIKQKIKFSVQGALQLKQDFDLIRDLIRSEYSLRQDLPLSLLPLRVFYQVDSAIVCLLQQPVAQPYTPLRGWHLFRSCCRTRAQVVDQTTGSLNNLETMDIQAACNQTLSQVEGCVTPKLVSTPPSESYLAVAQQEWLDLRVHSGSRRRIRGLQCVFQSEP
ncbi:coiled-coil domain-containing protein 142 isoform X5 [Brachyhypopomus gauderio]|uniref:coiled-coil domain-containing protein 142 isoform X5 n=1 Tax=Brachyhypopomus gauderio TaxID=698409 RepID=UPI0040434095